MTIKNINQKQAVNIVLKAVTEISGKDLTKLDLGTDLVNAGYIDSLDSMTLLFMIEKSLGKKLSMVNEEYEDYRVIALAECIVAETN